MRDFVKERDAYLRMESKLLKEYPGQFVGFHGGEFIAASLDKMELVEKIQVKAGNVRAYIREVAKEQPRVREPASRRMTP